MSEFMVPKIVGAILGGISILILVYLVSLFVKPTTGTVWESIKKGWSGPIPILLGFAFLYLAIWIFIYRLPGQWRRDWWHDTISHPYFFLCFAGVALFATMKKKDPKKLFIHSFGSVGVWLGIILCVGYFWMGEPSDKDPNATKLPTTKEARVASTDCVARVGFPPHNMQNKVLIEKFFREKKLPAEDVDQFVQIAERESGYNQFEEDGTPYRGRETCEDVGAMQINEGFHLEKEKTLGINFHTTLEGNLEMALWLYQDASKRLGHKHRFDAWKASEGKGSQTPTLETKAQKPDEEFIVVVKAGIWTEPIVLRAQYVMFHDAPLEYITAEGNPGTLNPGDKPRINTTTLRLRPTGGEEVKVTFTPKKSDD